MPDPHCCHCELFRVQRVTSPPTGMHKCCSLAREGRRGMVVVWPSNACRNCAYSAPDVTPADTYIYSDYCYLFIYLFALFHYLCPSFPNFYALSQNWETRRFVFVMSVRASVCYACLYLFLTEIAPDVQLMYVTLWEQQLNMNNVLCWYVIVSNISSAFAK